MLDYLIASARGRVRRRLWLISDLQQAEPDRAEHCMTRAVADCLALGMPVDAVCYLGDSVQGHDLAHIEAMTAMQLRELAKISAPVYYVPGNHDFDYYVHHRDTLSGMTIPFAEAAARHPQWRLAPTLQDTSFEADFGDFAVVFFPDHAAPDGAWYTTHGAIHGNRRAYPYDYNHWRDLCVHIAQLGKPVITMSHYNLPGGNREAPLYSYLLPLPPNVLMHIYGHAHVGDRAWAGVNCHRKLCGVDGHPVVQANIASLENDRGSAIRSAFLEYYDDGSAAILFRNHTLTRWDDCYFTAPKGGAYVQAP